ncbi:phosphatase PAP2 family protein [Pedobacter sp. Du54]|uniref:phosphatase PAP2 family protein n=1 Tax=Pedobacter anseongensis TaxID=3133439 RepID=UPI0030A3C301
MKKSKNVLILMGLAIVSFILLGFFVSANPVPAFDLRISLFLQKFHSDPLDKIMLGISLFGELPYSIIMVVLVALLFYLFKYKREAYFTLSILYSGLIILGVKNLINRPRPTAFYVRLVEINRFNSFPSGHVMSYILFFGFMILLMKQLKTIPLLTRRIISFASGFFILTIAFSRVYLGAHWFSDTLGGFMLGIICLFPLSYYYLKPHKKRIGDKT